MAKQQKSTELEVCVPVAPRKSLFERVAAHLDEVVSHDVV